MSLWSQFKCTVLGKCDGPGPLERSDVLVAKLEEGLDVTREIRDELKEIRESGIWPQDMIRGTYRVNRRTVKRGTH